MQGSNTHLDHVLTTLGNLYHIYSDPDLNTEVQDKALGSLETHWAACNQDPFIATIVLNPFLHERCLSRANLMLTPIGLCNMLKCLHLLFFKEAVDSGFQSAFMDYYNECKEFSSVFMALEEWKEMAKEKASLHGHTANSLSHSAIGSGSRSHQSVGGHQYT
jgi:hypothetical protein